MFGEEMLLASMGSIVIGLARRGWARLVGSWQSQEAAEVLYRQQRIEKLRQVMCPPSNRCEVRMQSCLAARNAAVYAVALGTDCADRIACDKSQADQ